MAAKATVPSQPARACSVGGRPIHLRVKRARAAWHGSETRQTRCPAAAAADLARCPCRITSANDVGWGELRVGREGNCAKSASARVLRGPSAGSPPGETRAGCAARVSNAVATMPRSLCRRPGAVSVRKSLGQRREGRPRPALAAKTTVPSSPARACSEGGRPVLHRAKRARVPQHGSLTR